MGLIAILVPIIVLLDDNHAPLAGVEEAPLSTPSPLLGGSEESYWAAGYALAAPGADGTVVQLRYAFGDLGSAAPFAQPLQLDEETRDWVSARHDSAVPTWISLSYGVVKLFCYKWVAGALFQQPELFLLSAAQWEALLRPWVQPPSEEGSIRTTALDVGAGTGWVTARYSHLFGEVVTTEVAVRPCPPVRPLARSCVADPGGRGRRHTSGDCGSAAFPRSRRKRSARRRWVEKRTSTWCWRSTCSTATRHRAGCWRRWRRCCGLAAPRCSPCRCPSRSTTRRDGCRCCTRRPWI